MFIGLLLICVRLTGDSFDSAARFQFYQLMGTRPPAHREPYDVDAAELFVLFARMLLIL